MARRAEAARKRRQLQIGVAAAVAVVLVVAGSVWLLPKIFGGKKNTAAAPTGPAPCAWTQDPKPSASPSPQPSQPADPRKDVGVPPTTGEARAGTRTMHLEVANQGVIEIEMDAKNAPCTTASFTYLAGKQFFDGTKCHRLVTQGFSVLQCGDPSGSGSGGPTYRFGDENLPNGKNPSYERGMVAMANGGPGTNGSQFFFIAKDISAEVLKPNYTIWGKVTKGMDIIDKIVAGGDDGAYAQQAGGGHPKIETLFTKVTVSDVKQP